MIQNILDFFSNLDIAFVVKILIGLFLIMLGFKVVNKVLKIVLKVVAIVFLITVVLRAIGMV